MEIVCLLSSNSTSFLTDRQLNRYIDESLRQDNARFDLSLFSGSVTTPSSLVLTLPPLVSEPLGGINSSSHSDATGFSATSGQEVFGHGSPSVDRIPSSSSMHYHGVSVPSSSSLDSLLRSAGVV